MKKTKIMQGFALLFSLAMISCSQGFENEPQVENGYGRLNLKLSSNTAFLDETRAVNEESYKNTDNYTVVVLDNKGNEKMNCKYSEVPGKMPLILPIGSYTVKAFYGTEHDASRDEFYVYGEDQGIIQGDPETVSADIECTPTCGRISVSFSPEMDGYFSDYNVSFTGTVALGENSIKWEKNDTEPWYVKLEQGGEKVSFTITVLAKDEFTAKETTKKGTFDLNRNKAYKINVSPVYSGTETGDVSLNITVDETTNDKPVDIEVPVDWL
ncbi:MAG: DUF4493 domain-containing protein [Bacteroidaceae bacterium]|nr:DUF4493 domain-containing protein [Bacteroidaceae bacterium]